MNLNIKQLFIAGFVVLNVTLGIFYIITSFTTLTKKRPSISNTNTPTNYTDANYLKQLLEDSEIRLQDVEQQLTKAKKISKLKIVTIDTPELHHYLRRLIGSIHKHHKDITIAVYALNLNIQQESEVRLWANVEFTDIISTFVVTQKLKVEYFYSPINTVFLGRTFTR
jgi:hypothetical protein